jgi:hypothetical protein
VIPGPTGIYGIRVPQNCMEFQTTDIVRLLEILQGNARDIPSYITPEVLGRSYKIFASIFIRASISHILYYIKSEISLF